MSDTLDLAAIKARRRDALEWWSLMLSRDIVEKDVPALLARVRELEQRLEDYRIGRTQVEISRDMWRAECRKAEAAAFPHLVAAVAWLLSQWDNAQQALDAQRQPVAA